jgi:hypothetical protein
VYLAKVDFELNLGSGGSRFEVIPDSGREHYNPPHNLIVLETLLRIITGVLSLISSSWGWWLAAATGGITIWIVVYLVRRAKRAKEYERVILGERSA